MKVMHSRPKVRLDFITCDEIDFTHASIYYAGSFAWLHRLTVDFNTYTYTHSVTIP